MPKWKRYFGINIYEGQEGARIIKGTSTIIMPPLIVGPQGVLIPGLIFKTGVPYYLDNQ